MSKHKVRHTQLNFCQLKFLIEIEYVSYIILKVEIQSSPFILINYYAPNKEGQQVQILTEISDILAKMELEEDTQLI